jgi:hypothetical protein
MKISRSFRLLLCVVGATLFLLSLMPFVTPCDEVCSTEAPTCECLCACYGKDMAVPASDVLPAMNGAQYGVPFESSQRSLLLATDIFRPPIA